MAGFWHDCIPLRKIASFRGANRDIRSVLRRSSGLKKAGIVGPASAWGRRASVRPNASLVHGAHCCKRSFANARREALTCAQPQPVSLSCRGRIIIYLARGSSVRTIRQVPSAECRSMTVVLESPYDFSCIGLVSRLLPCDSFERGHSLMGPLLSLAIIAAKRDNPVFG